MCRSHMHWGSRRLQMNTLKCVQPGHLSSTWSLNTTGTVWRFTPLLVHSTARLPNDKTRSELSIFMSKACYMWVGYSCFSAVRVKKISSLCKHCERKISYPICFPLTNISSITCSTLSLCDGIKNRWLQRSPHLLIDI